MNAQHSKVSAEWYTPAPFVQAARVVLGTIDLDPASCAKANETVQAARYFTKEDDGLRQPWEGRVFLNPPGGLVREFWRKLLRSYFVERGVTHAVWIGYSLQQLQTLQTDGPGPFAAASAICLPSRRIAFLNELGQPSKRPTHANYIAYIGPGAESFRRYFSGFGEVLL